MENWRYKAKSITKYNPVLFDENNVYLEDDWTSYSDIGKYFNGQELTYQEYLSVEEKYISACILFFNLLVAKKFQVEDIFKISKLKDFKGDDKNLLKYYKNLNNNSDINIDVIKPFIQLVLREYASFCIKIDEKTNSYIYFGYDYYMYFVSDIDLSVLNNSILDLNLFMS
jgi:hypothetical protein